MSAFNDNILLIRGITGLNQKLFAKLIKSNESNIKTWETTEVGTKNLTTLNILSELTGVTIPDLKNKTLDKKNIRIKVEMVEKVKLEAEGSDYERSENDSMVHEPLPGYVPLNRTADYLAGRLAEKDATIEQIEKRLQDAFTYAKKMEAHYQDVKAALERSQITINEVLKPIVDQSSELLSNSKKVQEGLLSLKTEVVAEHGEMMETLDQIAGNEPGTTAARAGTVEIAHQVQKNQKGKKANMGKQS